MYLKFSGVKAGHVRYNPELFKELTISKVRFLLNLSKAITNEGSRGSCGYGCRNSIGQLIYVR